MYIYIYIKVYWTISLFHSISVIVWLSIYSSTQIHIYPYYGINLIIHTQSSTHTHTHTHTHIYIYIYIYMYIFMKNSVFLPVKPSNWWLSEIQLWVESRNIIVIILHISSNTSRYYRLCGISLQMYEAHICADTDFVRSLNIYLFIYFLFRNSALTYT